jgi:hypothetical protein
MDLYNKLAATAARLINKYGQAVTLSRIVGGSVDPVTGAVVAGADGSIQAKGILLNYKAGDIDGTRIMQGDRMLVIDGYTFPLKTDVPQIGAEKLGSIVDIRSVSPGGTKIVHFLQMRL